MNSKANKRLAGNQEGFTLVEVIAVLVILGILAAVAVPKFFDMQVTARKKALEGAVGELNGQLSMSFAQNVLEGGTVGWYKDFGITHWDDFELKPAIDDDPRNNQATKIRMTDFPAEAYDLHWTDGTSGRPGKYSLGDTVVAW